MTTRSAVGVKNKRVARGGAPPSRRERWTDTSSSIQIILTGCSRLVFILVVHGITSCHQPRFHVVPPAANPELYHTELAPKLNITPLFLPRRGRCCRYPRPDPDASHTMAECSNMGTCIRSFGLCLCETGFEGRACERYVIPAEVNFFRTSGGGGLGGPLSGQVQALKCKGR